VGPKGDPGAAIGRDIFSDGEWDRVQAQAMAAEGRTAQLDTDLKSRNVLIDNLTASMGEFNTKLNGLSTNSIQSGAPIVLMENNGNIQGPLRILRGSGT
jgi:hypothetical protein